jgi:hypothetical protein
VASDARLLDVARGDTEKGRKPDTAVHCAMQTGKAKWRHRQSARLPLLQASARFWSAAGPSQCFAHATSQFSFEMRLQTHVMHVNPSSIWCQRTRDPHSCQASRRQSSKRSMLKTRCGGRKWQWIHALQACVWHGCLLCGRSVAPAPLVNKPSMLNPTAALSTPDARAVKQ